MVFKKKFGNFFICLVFAGFVPFSTLAGPEIYLQDIVSSIDTMTSQLNPTQEIQIAAEAAAAIAAHPNPEIYEKVVPHLDALAQLAQSAQRPSTQVRAGELYRQLLVKLIPGRGLGLQLLDAQNPMLIPADPGIGVTEADVIWTIKLQQLAAAPGEEFNPAALEDNAAIRRRAEIHRRFTLETEGSRYFLISADAWGAGVEAVWGELNPQERQIAASVTTKPDIPDAEILRKVIGTDNLLDWVLGIDIGLSDEEKARYPDLTTFLASGALAPAVFTKHVAQKMTQRTDLDVETFQSQTELLYILQDYNQELMFDKQP